MTTSAVVNRASVYLAGCGMTILDRNWEHPQGSIDLVAEERGQLVVVRVLTHPGRGKAAPKTSGATVRRLRRLAVAWMTAHGRRYDRVRVDSVTVLALPRAQYDMDHVRDLERR